MANFNKPTQSYSYMDFFQNNFRKDPIVDETVKAVLAVQGTCNSMCPEDEVFVREREHLVHALEVVGDQRRLVKRYARPAADTNLAVACNLRPFHILKKTVRYLLFEVTKRQDVNDLVIYNFVTDRLRAVRQDMIIQDFDPKLRITLLEPMIRFHTYYGYLLCEESINDFSPTLNKNILLECLKTCLYCYDELDLKSAEVSQDVNILINNMNRCNLEKDQILSLDRGLMEAIYVLTNFYDESPIWRLRHLNNNLRHAPAVVRAYALAGAALRGHYAAACRALSALCPLAFCAAALQLPRVQRNALRVISVAYSCRGRRVPLSALRGWLRLGEDAPATLRHYGLEVADGQVACQRHLFRQDAPLLPPKRLQAEHLQGKMNLHYILTYTSLEKEFC